MRRPICERRSKHPALLLQGRGRFGPADLHLRHMEKIQSSVPEAEPVVLDKERSLGRCFDRMPTTLILSIEGMGKAIGEPHGSLICFKDILPRLLLGDTPRQVERP